MPTTLNYEYPPLVEVDYQGVDGVKRTQSGFLHADQFSDGPSLVMNPDAFQVTSACCWSVPWWKITRLTIIDPGEIDLEVADAMAGHP